MTRTFLVALTVAVAVPTIAQTPAVDAARASGAVGERYDGYIGIAAPVSAAVRSQVATVNIKRRSLYSSLAGRKRASPQDVGITAGCHLLGQVGAGQSYMLSDGVWRRRGPGQGSPAPDYCR